MCNNKNIQHSIQIYFFLHLNRNRIWQRTRWPYSTRILFFIWRLSWLVWIRQLSAFVKNTWLCLILSQHLPKLLCFGLFSFENLCNERSVLKGVKLAFIVVIQSKWIRMDFKLLFVLVVLMCAALAGAQREGTYPDDSIVEFKNFLKIWCHLNPENGLNTVHFKWFLLLIRMQNQELGM